MNYLNEARQLLHSVMSNRYGENKREIEILEAEFKKAARSADGWTFEKLYQTDRSDRTFLNNLIRYLYLPLVDGNPYWDGSLFGFPENIPWKEIKEDLQNLSAIPLISFNSNQTLVVIGVLKKHLTTTSNAAHLLRFLCPEKFAMIAGYFPTGFFPFDFDPDKKIDFVERAYLNFCEILDKLGSKADPPLSVANTEHAIWVIWRISRWVSRNEALPSGIDTYFANELYLHYLNDKMVQKEYLLARPLDIYFRRAQQENEICLLGLADVYFQTSEIVAGKFARSALESRIRKIAMKNFPMKLVINKADFNEDEGIKNPAAKVINPYRDPEKQIEFYRLDFNSHLKLASAYRGGYASEYPIGLPLERSPASVKIKKSWMKIRDDYAVLSACAHVPNDQRDMATRDKIREAIKTTQEVCFLKY